MMKNVATWSAWEQREYRGCGRVGSVCTLSFSLSLHMMVRCEVGGILLAPLEVSAPSEVMFGLRAYISMGSGSAGHFLSNFFSFLYERAQLDDYVDVFGGVFYGLFLMALVSFVVAL